MNKSIVQGKLLVDNCPSCGGIWLDGDELEIMREMLVQQGRAQASFPFFFPFWMGAI
jgi:Zn-finger nucleic acid-binding protein